MMKDSISIYGKLHARLDFFTHPICAMKMSGCSSISKYVSVQ